MRLVDADEFKKQKVLEKLRTAEFDDEIEDVIEKIPTAYDVDKAGERLKVAFERTVAEILDRADSEFTIADFNIGKYTERLEEIVRTGGVE